MEVECSFTFTGNRATCVIPAALQVAVAEDRPDFLAVRVKMRVNAEVRA